MNVLTIVQNFLVGGLETRIQGEIKWANDHGHGTYLATSENFVAESLPDTTLGITTGLDIGDSASTSGLMSAVDCLVDIVQDNDIDVIHAHPFSALLPAMLASQLTKTPLVVSLHGPASLSPSQRKGQWRMHLAFALTHASLIACVSPEVKALATKIICHDRIEIFPNCVDVQKHSRPSMIRSSGRWALIGRLDRDKKDGVIEFLNASKCFPIRMLDVIGDGECRSELEKYVRISSYRLPPVRFLGAKQEIMSEMTEYDAVAGMGRVVLEAVAMSVPIVLAGYDGVKGWVDEDLFLRAAYSNFSGRGIENATESELRDWPISKSGNELEKIRRLLLSEYDEKTLWGGFYSKIKNLSFTRCVVTDEAINAFRHSSESTVPYSEHPGVVKEIESILRLKERECFVQTANGRLSDSDCRTMLQMARGWRIGEMDELCSWYEAQIGWRDKEISRVKNSVSWRITRPVRCFESVINRIQNSAK